MKINTARGFRDVIAVLAAMVSSLSPLSARADVKSDAQVWIVLRAHDAQGLGQLIAHGVDVSGPGFLKYAAESDQPGIVLVLLRHGCDPNGWTTDRYGMSPTASPVYLAAKRGNRETLQVLKEQHANFDAESPSDASAIGTPLLSAVFYGDFDTARLLIEFGADVNHFSRAHNTALMQALTFLTAGNQAQFVKLLLAHGANPDIANDQGVTARMAAYARPEISALIAAAKPPGKDQGPPPGGAEELQNIQMVLVIKMTCDANLSGFKQETADAYRRWREPRKAWIDAFEKSPRYQMVLEQSKSQDSAAKAPSAAQQASQQKELENTCRGGLLDELARGSGAAAADPALSSPEKTWDHYLASLRQGDRRAAIGCLTSTARDKFRPVLQQFTPEQMHGMADAVQSFTLTQARFGNTAEAAVAMKSGAGGLVYFENMNGEWRISEM